MVKQMTMSKGKCTLCSSVFSGKEMEDHLKLCKSKNDIEKKKSLQMMVQCPYLPEYWMYLEVDANAKLKDLDDFLRKKWLECCGHLSAFTIGKKRYESDGGMNVKLDKVIRSGVTLSHEYDFGSTTELSLKVVSEGENKIRGDSIYLMARNEPPLLNCMSCGKKASFVCCECICSEDEAWLCGKCAKKHECGEEMLLPIVNSPRVGVCGYCGSEKG